MVSTTPSHAFPADSFALGVTGLLSPPRKGTIRGVRVQTNMVTTQNITNLAV